MARQNHIQNNLNAGEFSPRLRGRTDIDNYYNAVGRMKNFIPLPFGGAQKTPGTKMVREVRDSSKTARIFDWVFGSRQAYILQFNDGKIRFYKDKGFVFTEDSPLAIEAITNANPGVVTITGHGLINGDEVTFQDVDGIPELSGQTYTVANKTTDTFQIADSNGNLIDTSSYGRFVTTGQCKLLLNCNGTDAGTTFTDGGTGHTITANGNAQIDTAQQKFGTASGLFDGTGDYLTAPDHADWNFGSSDFTIDFWVRFNAATGIQTFWMQSTDGSNFAIFHHNFSSGNWSLQVQVASSDVVAFTGADTLTTGTWYHVALVRNGNTWTIYRDGVSKGSTTDTSSWPDLTGVINIGRSDQGSADYFNGWIDDFRVTKGFARWTAAFTPPTTEAVKTESILVDAIYEIDHTYADAELFEIQTAQAGDIMYLAQGDTPIQKLSRFDDDNWTIADVDFKDGPYLDENATATTLDPSATSGSVTVTASAATGINDDQGFLTTDVGRLIRYHDGTNWFWMKITARTSTTEVTATIQYKAGDTATTTMGGHAATKRWRLGAWSATTGYPRSVTFYQGRLCFGGTSAQPQHVWESVVFDYENMNPGSQDDADAITYQLNSNQVNIIKWLTSGKRLVAGTEGENFTLYSGNSSEPITPATIKADSETNDGCSDVEPVKIGPFFFFVGADEKTVFQFGYNYEIDGYESTEQSIYSEHLTREGIKEIAYQKRPYGVMYAVMDDGKLATLTRHLKQQVLGWASQDISATRPNDKFKSVAVIPASGYDEVWFVVQRSINGETKQYVEYQVDPNQDVDNDLEDMVLMQSTLSYDSTPATTFSGLFHLEGETVVVLADGEVITGKTVSNGQVTLTDAASVVHIGLPVTSQIKLLPLEAGSTIGSAQGMLKKVAHAVIAVYRTLGLKIGEEGGNMEELLVDGNGDTITDALQTDDFTVPSTLGWDRKQEMLIEQTKPLPATVLSVNLFEYTAEELAAQNP